MEIKISRDEIPTFLKYYCREMTNNSYSLTTIKIYKKYLERFIQFSFTKGIIDPAERIAEYIDLFHSPQTRSQAFSAVKLFYRLVLKKELPYKITHRKKKNLFPDVWSKADIMCLLDRIENPKHKLMISMLYGSGLRVSEVVKIKIKDLNLEKCLLTVGDSKGFKSRKTVISDTLIESLIITINGRSGEEFLFLSESPIQKEQFKSFFIGQH